MTTLEQTDTREIRETGISEEILHSEETSAVSFKVKRPVGLIKKEEWDLAITPDSIRFSLPEDNKVINIRKEEAISHIEFPNELTLIQSRKIIVNYDGEIYHFMLDKTGQSELRSWIPKKSAAEMKTELRKWGVGLIILGGAHLALTDLLDPVWGVIIAIIGVLNLLIPKKGMFILNDIGRLYEHVCWRQLEGFWYAPAHVGCAGNA